MSFRFVLAGPTAPATASLRHQLATVVFPLPLLKQCVFLHSYNCATHRSFYWSIFKSLPTNYFFYPYRPLSFALLQHSSMSADNQLGDHGDLCSHFFPNVLWIQHLQIVFDFNILYVVWILVINWHKTEIDHYLHKCWFFFFFKFTAREEMWIGE